jgi:carboxypeptidase C (cathepsin A)
VTSSERSEKDQSKDRGKDAAARAETGETADRPAGSAGDATDRELADDLVVTSHSLRIGRKALGYTATTGRIVLREEEIVDGIFKGYRARAELFITSYVLDGAEPARRPVTFAFNGGPGSSSVWLHLGLFGPRRIVMGDAGNLLPPPYELADNHESLLAVSDLVFIDPVSTGYSRMAEGGKADEYHGYARDLDAVGEVIRLWTSRNGRWMSPKFLAGESYGTVRAAALADDLQEKFGLYCNGVMLLSSVLDFATIRPHPDNDLPPSLFLPTYAAIAHYHGRHGRKSLRSVLREAEDFSSREYPYLLGRGNRLTESERTEAAARIAELAGLSADYVVRSDLRIEHTHFYTELLRSTGKVVGRLDGRFTGWLNEGVAEVADADPSFDAIVGPYAAGFNHYVRAELGYASDLPYELITPRVYPWSYKEFEGQSVNVTRKLARAMRANPHLRVHVAFGYHDGATPYFAAEHVLAHLPIAEELRANIESAYYPAGHMMYVHEPSRIQQSEELANFVRSSSRSVERTSQQQG